ncbi:MAG: PIN domain-containing protein [Thermoplasmatota archaeon]
MVDTNILFSFFNAKSTARDISTRYHMLLYSPVFSLKELDKYKDVIMKRFSLTEMQYVLMMKFLQTVINFVEEKEYESFLPKAKRVSPDPDDIDFFALSFSLNCQLWSNDSLLKNQSLIDVLSTKDLVEKFDL